MRYIKNFEGFTYDQLNNLILNGNTYINKMDRNYNNKEMKYSKEIIDYDIYNFKIIVQYNNYNIYPDLNFINLYKKYCIENNNELDSKIKEFYE